MLRRPALALVLFVAVWFSPVLAGRILLPFDFVYHVDPAFGAAAPEDLPAQPSNLFAGWDRVYSFYPWFAHNVRSLRAGVMPLWNPFAGAGSPHLPLDQPAVLDPLSTGIGVALGPAWAETGRAVLATLVAALGMLALARRRGLPPMAGLVGGLAFAFGGWFTLWLGRPATAAAAWLPWMLWAADRLVRRDRPASDGALLAGFTALAWLAGHPGTAAHGMVLTFVFGVWTAFTGCAQPSPETEPALGGRSATQRPRATVAVLGGLLAGVALAAVVLLPFLAFLLGDAGGAGAVRGGPALDLADRVLTILRGQASWPRLRGTLITAVVPVLNFPGSMPYASPPPNLAENTIYVGMTTLLLVPAALRFGSRDARFWALAAAVALLTALHLPLAELGAQIPVLRLTNVERFRMLWSLAAAMTAAHGAAALLRSGAGPPDLRRRLYLLGGVGVMLLGALWTADLLTGATPDSLRRGLAGFAAGALLLALAIRLPRHRLGLAAVMVLGMELAAALHGAQPAERPATVFPEIPVTRYLRAGGGRIMTLGMNGQLPLFGGMPTYYEIESVEAFNVLHPQRLRALYDAVNADAPAAGQLFRDYLVLDAPGHPLVDLLGVRHLVTPAVPRQTIAATGALTQFRPVWSDGHVQVLENPDPLPRAFLAPAVVVADDEADALRRIADPAFPLRDTVVVESPVAAGTGEPLAAATLSRTGPNRIRVEVDAPASGLLVVTEAYTPGWRARVSDVPVRVMPADYAVLGVPIPSGRHVVELRYIPPWLGTGLVVSLLTLTGLIARVALERRRAPARECPRSTGDDGGVRSSLRIRA